MERIANVSIVLIVVRSRFTTVFASLVTVIPVLPVALVVSKLQSVRLMSTILLLSFVTLPSLSLSEGFPVRITEAFESPLLSTAQTTFTRERLRVVFSFPVAKTLISEKLYVFPSVALIVMF